MWINSWVYPDALLVLICVDDVLITKYIFDMCIIIYYIDSPNIHLGQSILQSVSPKNQFAIDRGGVESL